MEQIGALLHCVELEHGTAILEYTLVVSYKGRHSQTIPSSNHAPGYLFK